MATAAEELVLLERVFLRLGSAETDEQFENVLAKFLPPVLLKLSSQEPGVRKKVMELLLHVNKRVKSRPQVQLPIDALLLQYQDPDSTPFVINFTIIYLKLGFPRLPLEKQIELVPTIINSLESKPQTHQDSLLLLIVPLLNKITVPTDPAKRATFFGLRDKPQISKYFLSFLLDLLLLPYGVFSPPTSQAEGQSSDNATVSAPPGMSEFTFKRVTGETPIKPEELEQIKLGIVKFLSNDIFLNEDIILPLIVAAADTRFSVANLADMELKKVAGLVDWTSSTLSMRLFMLFLGTTNQNLRPNLKKAPANTRIRLKLLNYLNRVTGNGFVVPLSIFLIFDSLYGTNTNTKLKTLALTFASNLVQYADENKLSGEADVLKFGMIKLTDEGEVVHQGKAFVILGLIGRRFPKLVYHDITILELFLSKLGEAPAELKLQIREGALNVISAYKYDVILEEVDKNDRLNMLFLLMKAYAKFEESMVRFVVVRCLATIFPPNHVPSKYLLLIATGDLKDEVGNEAVKALYGTARKADVDLSKTDDTKEGRNVSMPNFIDMTKYIYNDAQIRLQDKAEKVVYGVHVLPFNIKVFVEILTYLRLCLIRSLNVPLTREIIKHPTEDTPIIRNYLQSIYSEKEPIESNPLLQYASLTKQLLITNQAIEPFCCMVEIIGCVPQLHTMLKEDMQWLRDLTMSTKEEVREFSSLLFGIVASELFCDKTFKTSMQYLVEQASNKNLETQSGAILSLGNCFERRIIKSDLNNKDESIITSKCFKNTVELLVSSLSNTNALIISSSCLSLGLIGKSCGLPLNSNKENETTGSPDAKRIAKDIITKQSLVDQLLEIMNNVKLATKCREKAAKCLGLLCVGENFPCTKEVMLGLLNTVKETKDVEVHFTIGESLVMAVQSIWSPEARDPWTTLPKDYTPSNSMEETMNDDNLEWLLLQLLKYAEGLHPNSKQAASIWLLALLKSCIDRDSIKNRLNILQNTFMNLLGENNDIVQDVASKGLCLIYDYSKSEELLAALVEQLTTGRRQAVQVTDETKLFEEGQLGQTPSGGKLSTYKELCSLASELNKPDLIYQFMHLANHNAIWNSKKGAAFGFSSIAEKCGEHLQTYLPKILPKLYRYQYDPSPNLHASMQSIWRALVQEPQKMMEKYHNEILEELLSNLNSSQYRVRQSCALALQDFLKGAGYRSIHDSVHAMDELWNKLFRVMDDHHEQTRIAGTKTTRILSKLCIRGCDVGQGKNGVKMMEAILPVLLNVGINSPVSEVRLISLQTISELVGAAGNQLRPFLHQLIPALLIATGELESSKLSYLSTMYGGQSQVQEVLDSARASLAKSHFTTETVSKCLQYADVTILEELIPKVVDLMKSTVALGTRVACAHFITLLTLQLRKDLQPYTGKLLAALVNGLTDRNSSIRKHNALAIGHLVSTAKESSLEKLFSKIQHWYFEREDDSIRSACALTIQSIGNHNQEILKEYSDVVLPLVFFAMHAEKTTETQKTLEIWNDIWAEQSPGTESGIRQNIEPICTILKTALESPSWTMKAQSANAVSTVATKLGQSMDAKHRNALVQILISGLSGRTWNGKEHLLKALASICSSCKEAILENKEINYNEIIDGVLKESRKEEIVYKTHSLEALGNILSSLEVDRFEDIYKLVESVLTNEGSSGSKDDEDEDMSTEEIGSLRENKLKLQKTVYDLLGNAWPKNSKETQAKYNEMFVEHCVACLPTTTRNVQVSIMGALCNYVDKLVLLDGHDLNDGECKSLDKIIKELLTALKYTLGITKHTLLRKEALNVYFSLGKKLKDSKRQENFKIISNVFEEYLPEITKDNQPEIKSRVIDLKNLFTL